MQVPYKILSFLFILSFQITLTAQQQHLVFDKIGNKEGFNQNTITSIIQDQKGFLWFATPNGLIRYNGIEYRTFKHKIGDPSSLSFNQVLVLQKDTLGRFIIGTQQGLCRFDPGKEIFESIPGMESRLDIFQNSYISAVILDHDNHLWIGTRNGLFHADYSGKTPPEKFQPDLNGSDLSGTIINDLLEDRQNNIWIASYIGLICIPENRQGKALIFNHQPGNPYSISSDQVTSLMEKRNGQLLAGTATGLDQILTKPNPDPDKPGESYSFYSYPEIKSQINCLHETDARQIWAGSQTAGLYIIDPSGKKVYNCRNIKADEKSLSVNLINTIVEDHTGMIWIGTAQGGLNTFNPHKKKFLKIELNKGIYTSYEENLINGLFQDADRKLWISTYNNGIHHSSKALGNIYSREPDFQKIIPPDRYVSTNLYRCFFKDRRNRLWIGSGQGLLLYDLEKQQFLRLQISSELSEMIFSTDISSIAEDSKGNIWIGTTYNGVCVIEEPSDIFSKKNPSLIHNYRSDRSDSLSISSNYIRSVYPDKSGRIWICTTYGLNAYAEMEDGTPFFKKYHHNEMDPGSISADNIFCIYQDSREVLWAGTFGGGLNKIITDNRGNVDHFTSYFEEDGLADNAVYSILEDRHYKLWISTDNGISCFSPLTEDFKNYNMHDGLPQNNHRQGSYLKNDRGIMFFGGPNGITAFHPDSIKDNPVRPKMAFTELRIHNRTIKIGEKVNGKPVLNSSLSSTDHLVFNYKNNNFTIGFSALHYAAPLKNSYSYYLEGYDLGWIGTGALQNFASYTNLDPGEYTFYVKGANNDGVWNEEPISMLITIQSAPWSTLWARILYAVLILLIILFIYRYISRLFLLQNRLKMETIEKENIEKLNQAKLRFFTNISHDFRTPLTLILGSTERLLKTDQTNNPLKDIFILIRKNSNLLLKLVNQLMDFRKIEMGHMKIKAAEADIVAFTRDLASYFNGLAYRKNIQLVCESTTEPILTWFDPDIFSKIFLNLLSNAFNYTPEYGMISVQISQRRKDDAAVPDTDEVICSISDSGKGIPADKLERIFDRFYQIEDKVQGTGIGLALVKSYTELHHGSIEVHSTVDKGTTFIVSLPLGRAHLSDDEIASRQGDVPGDDTTSGLSYYFEEDKPGRATLSRESDSEKERPSSLQGEADSPLSAQKRSILVIDDNEDLRNHLVAILSDSFEVHEAKDGTTGLRNAENLLPDLIVCDVMMPEPNGFEVCNTLKNNMNTSHIPVILLTALSEMENRIEGFEYGADEYISKPFSSEYLLVRIKNLIRGRQKMYSHFSRNTVLKPRDVKITTIDEKFLAELQSTIEEAIKDPGFSVEKLADKLNVSHMQLYRKTKALTGMTPVEFIRNYRLLTAVKMMEADPGLSLQEIMYKVGFNSQSYFTRCFKEKFGKNPSSYSQSG